MLQSTFTNNFLESQVRAELQNIETRVQALQAMVSEAIVCLHQWAEGLETNQDTSHSPLSKSKRRNNMCCFPLFSYLAYYWITRESWQFFQILFYFWFFMCRCTLAYKGELAPLGKKMENWQQRMVCNNKLLKNENVHMKLVTKCSSCESQYLNQMYVLWVEGDC